MRLEQPAACPHRGRRREHDARIVGYEARPAAGRGRFLEPHGMRFSGGLAGNQDKIDALKELQAVSDTPLFRAKNIAMDGFLLTQTEAHKTPDAGGRTVV